MIVRNRRARRALAVVVPVLLVPVCFSATGSAAASRAGHAATSAASAREALRFWTPARMRQARPLEAAATGTAEVAHAGASRQAPAPHRLPPRAPNAGATASSAFEVVGDPTAPGSSENGAIFVELAFGELARCSGTSVNAPNLSVVFTAGHCINSGGPGGRWLRGKWVFVPGYRYGQRPFGVFAAKWLDTTRRWLSTGSENFDVGAAVVGRNERGQRLGEAVGGAGIAWGLPANQVFDVHGYPVGAPFDGETQRLCPQTSFLGHDVQSFLEPGPLNLAVDCNVTGGASGGGWTIAGGLLNSVTDYGYLDDPATDFGAYFGKEVGRLFGRAAKVR